MVMVAVFVVFIDDGGSGGGRLSVVDAIVRTNKSPALCEQLALN